MGVMLIVNRSSLSFPKGGDLDTLTEPNAIYTFNGKHNQQQNKPEQNCGLEKVSNDYH